MIEIKSITGQMLKRELDLRKAQKRYHNKNKSGGNFGFSLFPHEKPDLELVGLHDTDGIITSLRFKLLWEPGGVFIVNQENKNIITLDHAIEQMQIAIVGIKMGNEDFLKM